MLRKVLVAFKAVFVSVEEGQALIRQHFGLLQLGEDTERRALEERPPPGSTPCPKQGRFLTASSGSPWKNLRSGSSRYCLQSTHLGGVVCKTPGGRRELFSPRSSTSLGLRAPSPSGPVLSFPNRPGSLKAAKAALAPTSLGFLVLGSRLCSERASPFPQRTPGTTWRSRRDEKAPKTPGCGLGKRLTLAGVVVLT